MCTTTDEPSALNGTSKLPPVMKKKLLRMAASSFLYMPPMGMLSSRVLRLLRALVIMSRRCSPAVGGEECNTNMNSEGSKKRKTFTAIHINKGLETKSKPSLSK